MDVSAAIEELRGVSESLPSLRRKVQSGVAWERVKEAIDHIDIAMGKLHEARVIERDQK